MSAKRVSQHGSFLMMETPFPCINKLILYSPWQNNKTTKSEARTIITVCLIKKNRKILTQKTIENKGKTRGQHVLIYAWRLAWGGGEKCSISSVGGNRKPLVDEDSRACFIRTIKISPAQEKDLRQQWVTDFRKTKWCQIQSGGRKSVFHLKTSSTMQCSLYSIESKFHVVLELLLWNTSVGMVKHYFRNANPFLETFNRLGRQYVDT